MSLRKVVYPYQLTDDGGIRTIYEVLPTTV